MIVSHHIFFIEHDRFNFMIYILFLVLNSVQTVMSFKILNDIIVC